jgi:hypothetical protein
MLGEAITGHEIRFAAVFGLFAGHFRELFFQGYLEAGPNNLVIG